MESIKGTQPDPAAERLASEVADVKASITMVASGAADRITLTGLLFGQQVAERLAAEAARQGVELEATFWPEDAVGDLHISRATRTAGTPTGEGAGRG
jgi:hypothetical protein